MSQTLIEKIAQKYAVDIPDGKEIHSGDYISFKPAYVMTHDNTGAVIPKFNNIGAKKLFNPRQVVITLDHNVQDKSEKNLEKYNKIEDFAKMHGADFYPAGRGIGHQIMCEEGYAWPGTMVVASDSHSNMYGGLGCLGTPIVRTDAAAIWATGRTWWQVPPIINVKLINDLNPGVTGKDLIISLCGYFNQDEVLNHAIEFTGDGVKYLTVDERLTVANMTTEWGALAGVFEVDLATILWLKKRANHIIERGLDGVASDTDGNGLHPRMNLFRIFDLEKHPPEADKNAFYAKEIIIDLRTIKPSVSGPNSVKTFAPITAFNEKEIKINKAYLVSCVNSRASDIYDAAEAIKGKKVAPGVEFYIAAASRDEQIEVEKHGTWKKLIDAGAIPLPPGCGPCIGLGMGLLEDGEVGISATNRNFKGRMGSPNAQAYLASPAVVASSAVAGKIYFDWNENNDELSAKIKSNKRSNGKNDKVNIIDGFPESISGKVIFCYQDNLNTDGIYPGKYTYQDNITPEQQAEVVMENYDPEFVKIAGKDDVLIGGFNFGTGSSREQAATALKYKGIKMVIAGSLNETYKRNAINNGFLLIECPDLVNDLKKNKGTDKLTKKIDETLEIDFINSKITFENKSYEFSSVGEAAQELIVLDGLENWIKKNL
ncbi:MAG TPA: homoaconitase [Ignavibacteriaceae bacterium]|nr:homoaconitase [Ignavibacteriaceae bacterium]